MARSSLLLVLVAGLAVAHAARGPVANDLCGTCKSAVRVIKDMLCDTEVDGAVVDWVIDNVCPATGNAKSCADVVNGVAPALFDWLRLGTDAGEMCAEVGVCGKPPSMFAAAAKAHRVRASSRASNDMTCPLCMFVVTKVKEQLSDPTTREAIHDKTAAACALLPEGSMREACTGWTGKYEDTIFQFVDSMEAGDLCALIGSCLLSEKLLASPLPRLSKEAVAALAPLADAAAGAKALRLRAAGAAPSNDNCDACKVVVAEMHSALANPSLQEQVVQYAKAVCDSMGSFADACKERIDQYAPMAFGMILAYLQPDQVCRQLGMCPPPSLAAQLLRSVSSALSPDRFAIMVQGAPVAGPHPADFLRLPRT